MPVSKLFWFLASITLIFIALQSMGYKVIDVIFALLIVDIVVVEVLRSTEKNKLGEEFRIEMMNRFRIIENTCKNLTDYMNSGNIVEKRLVDVLETQKKQFNDSLDMMAKKMIDLENTMGKMKKTFSSAIGVFDDRMASLELPEEPAPVEPATAAIEDEYVELESLTGTN